MRPLLVLVAVSALAVSGSAAVRAARPAPAAYTLDTALEDIAANPAGAAIVRKDIPGLLEHSSYPMFKGMSLRLLGSLSGGRLTAQMLAQAEADLANVPAPANARLRTIAAQGGDPDFD